MFDIKVCLDTKPFKIKPIGNEVGQIVNRIAKNVKVLNCPAMLSSFVKNVGVLGHTFVPAIFSNGLKRTENFEQMQLLVLDFDGGINYEDVFDRAKKYDVPILFAYNTFSSTEDNERFRICFLNDVAITDPRAAKISKNLLRKIFPESDVHDNDISRMYYGGNHLLYYNPNAPSVNFESLVRNMTIYMKDRYKGNYKRELKRFARDNKIALNESGLLDISIREIDTENHGAYQNDENSPSTIIMLNNTNGEISSNMYYRIKLDDMRAPVSSVELNKKCKRNHGVLRAAAMSVLGERCKLYNEFQCGCRRLKHEEIFGLVTNIQKIETGERRFLELLRKNSYYEDKKWKYEKWKKDLSFMKDYYPMSCDKFCPYSDTCNHEKNMVLTCKPKSHIKVNGYEEEFVSIEEVVDDLNRYLQEAIDANDNKIHVIKAQTAIGKTKSYIEKMKDSSLRFFIANSTNILKNEVFDRAIKAGIDVVCTPSLHEIKDEMPGDIWDNIEQFYRTGQYHKVHPYIKGVIEKNNIKCLKDYVTRREEVKESHQNIISTHRNLLYSDKDLLHAFDVILIDEDIVLKSLIPDHISISISDLRDMKKKSTNIAFIEKVKKLLKCIRAEKLFALEGFECDKDEIEKSATIDIPSFCKAKYFYYRKADEDQNVKEDEIVFINSASLHENVKYIVVSATADEEIYRYVFGDRVEFYECRKAKYKGTLNQYVGKSFSRASIENKPGVLDIIARKTQVKNMVTFKRYNKGLLYIGNVEGSNIYEGEDLNVVATPYEVEFIYKLFAYSLGLDCNYDDEMKTQEIIRNGYKFKMKTYEDEILQNLQLWMIESQLEQAVGRSRLLRHNCVVNLFSNYVLDQAEIKFGFDFKEE